MYVIIQSSVLPDELFSLAMRQFFTWALCVSFKLVWCFLLFGVFFHVGIMLVWTQPNCIWNPFRSLHVNLSNVGLGWLCWTSSPFQQKTVNAFEERLPVILICAIWWIKKERQANDFLERDQGGSVLQPEGAYDDISHFHPTFECEDLQ